MAYPSVARQALCSSRLAAAWLSWLTLLVVVLLGTASTVEAKYDCSIVTLGAEVNVTFTDDATTFISNELILDLDASGFLRHNRDAAPTESFDSPIDLNTALAGTQAVHISSIVDITVNAGIGQDHITITGALSLNDFVAPDFILNGGDDDDLIIGSAGEDSIDGGPGNDVIYGLGGNDTLTGGVGNDEIYGGTGSNNVSDGTGNDLVDLSENAVALSYTTGGGNDRIIGTPFVDNVNLTVATGARTTQAFPSTSGSVDLTGGNDLQYAGIEQLTITSTGGGTLTSRGTDGNDAITLALVSGSNRLTVNDGTAVNFTNFGTVALEGRSGSDSISVSGAGLVGVTAVTVDGGDPTASDTLIVNATAANNTIGYNPTTLGAGSVTVSTLPSVSFTTIESVVIEGQGGTDTLTHTTPAGVHQVAYTPGTGPDVGTIATRGAGAGTGLVPLTFRHIGAAGSVTFASGAGAREDFFELNGTNDSDVFNVNSPADAIQILNPTNGFVTVRLNTGGIGFVQLRGLNGDDVFNLSATLPYSAGVLVDGGDPSASDVLNHVASANAATTISLGASSISSTGSGPVSFIGIEVVNHTSSGAPSTLTVTGTASDDAINVTPTGAGAGSFVRLGLGGAPLFTYTGVGGAFTITGGSSGFDTVGIFGNDADDTVTTTATSVTIKGGTVELGSGVDQLNLKTFGGNDSIVLTGLTIAKTVDAGAGNDTVDLSAAVDANINGGDGDDSLTGSPAADIIDGGPGNDTLLGLGGIDVLAGGDGNDTLTGGAGADQMFGGAGSDKLIWNPGDGNDLVEGGTGTDEHIFNGAAAGEIFGIITNGARTTLTRNVGAITMDIGETEQITVNGLDGNDTFNVAPQATAHIVVNGGNPVPPAAPGDQLNVDFTGTIDSTLTSLGVGAGIWSFGNRQSVNFTGIETQGPVQPGISINNVAVAEGNAGSANATFTATLSAASAQTVSVDVFTSNGTATAPVDYQSANATLTFLPGVTTANFSVPINGDTTPEGNETYFVNLTNPVNAVVTTPQGTGTINDDDATSIFQFSSPTASVAENAVPGSATVTVTRAGDTTGAASVKFETSDGSAKQKTDYTFGYGTVQFGPGEVSKDVKILIVNDVFVEGPETFQVSLSNPSGNSAVGSPNPIVVTITDDDIGPAANPIDDAGFFVRQHYLDFLGREPDAAGLAFWTNNITSCGADSACVAVKRIDTSAAFFLSIEFQETSGNVIRTQRVAFGRQSNDQFTRVPYLQFMRDTRQIGQGVIIGQPGADALLEANKQFYAEQTVLTAEFTLRFPPAPGAVYVDALFASAGATPTAAERTAAINAFGAGGTTGRIAALRSVVDSGSVRTVEFSPSFVLAEYYGYLRRNPTDAPDFNDSGYQFWLNKMNTFNGDFRAAEMVKAFITSAEYRGRFGTP